MAAEKSGEGKKTSSAAPSSKAATSGGGQEKGGAELVGEALNFHKPGTLYSIMYIN